MPYMYALHASLHECLAHSVDGDEPDRAREEQVRRRSYATLPPGVSRVSGGRGEGGGGLGGELTREPISKLNPDERAGLLN